MKTIIEIVESLEAELREHFGDALSETGIRQQLATLTKAATRMDFRLKRTVLDKNISHTVLKNTIVELEKQKEIVETQSKFKEELFASVSHELRTPLHGILGMSHLLSKTELSAPQQKYANIIRGSADNLLVIINDILRLTQLNVGKTELVSRPFQLREIFDEIEGALTVKAAEKNLKLHFEMDDSIPEFLLGDHTRVYQLLINLLNNSVKFTKKGSVKLKTKVLSKQPEKLSVVFEIVDTGIGISKVKQEQIFKPFSRVHNQQDTIIEGAGLGLNIVKKLVDLIGGKIEVQSEEGQGTCFSVYLEFAIPDQCADLLNIRNAQDLSIPVEWQQHLVLMIEDNPANIIYAETLFSEWNMKMIVATNYEEGERLLSQRKYDLILSDVKLPDGDGMDLVKNVRANPEHTNSKTPVIILTASANENEQKYSRNLNIQSYLSKPFQPATLIIAMKKVFQPEVDANDAINNLTTQTPVSADYFTSLHSHFINQPEIMKKMLLILQSQIPATILQLANYLKAEDYKGFHFEIHKIKSTILLIGLPHLIELTDLLEDYSAQKINLDKIPDLFEKFKDQATQDLTLISSEITKIEVAMTASPV